MRALVAVLVLTAVLGCVDAEPLAPCELVADTTQYRDLTIISELDDRVRCPRHTVRTSTEK